MEGRWLSSRHFVNGWVWSSHFLSIPEEGGAVITEGVGTLKESVSGDTRHLWPPVQRPAALVSATRGCFVSILFIAVVILNNYHSCLGCTGFLTVCSHHRHADKVA